MFKNFLGYKMVESYHEWKKKQRNGEDEARKKLIKMLKIAFVVLVTLTVLLIPTPMLGLGDISVIQHRLVAIFLFATLMWLLEPIPSWTTSVLSIVLMLLMITDSGLRCFIPEEWAKLTGDEAKAIGIVSNKDILHCFADPIIELFIGGFILAIAATKTGLDAMLARVMLKPFGTKSHFVLLGFILVTALFSMFISNTATAAMMLTFLAPVLRTLPADGKGKIALALAIPIAANIGGIGTPIGTPPNAIALKYLNDPAGLDLGIGFGQWMAFMTPLAIVLLLIAWGMLLFLFPFKQKKIVLDIKGETRTDWQAIVVYVTFAVTVLLWVLDKFTGVNANVVAMIPVAVFCVTGIVTKRDLEEINWSVLWMVAGGFALGVGLQKTGLAATLIEEIPFGTWSPVLVIIGSGLLCYAMANFISHTATAALLVPILAVVGTSIQAQLGSLGGVETLLIGVALGSSLAMVLPISTPPNALAHATGLIEQKDMMKVGILMGIIGLIIGYVMLIIVGSAGLL